MFLISLADTNVSSHYYCNSSDHSFEYIKQQYICCCPTVWKNGGFLTERLIFSLISSFILKFHQNSVTHAAGHKTSAVLHICSMWYFFCHFRLKIVLLYWEKAFAQIWSFLVKTGEEKRKKAFPGSYWNAFIFLCGQRTYGMNASIHTQKNTQ